MAVSFVIVAFYYLLPETAIGILYGKGYLDAKSGLLWMGLAAALYTGSNLLASFFMSIGKTKIVLLPIVLAVFQIVGISIWHRDFLQVIYVTLLLMSILFVGLVCYLGYNQFQKTYVKKI